MAPAQRKPSSSMLIAKSRYDLMGVSMTCSANSRCGGSTACARPITSKMAKADCFMGCPASSPPQSWNGCRYSTSPAGTMRHEQCPMPPAVLTVGHSNHALDQFLTLLARHGVDALVDIRRFPGSRKHPQFNRDNLAAALRKSGVEYHWLEALG